jgi:hypothetical protein
MHKVFLIFIPRFKHYVEMGRGLQGFYCSTNFSKFSIKIAANLMLTYFLTEYYKTEY